MAFISKNIYKFETLAPTILGANYNNLEVVATATSEIASKYIDVYQINNQLVPIINNLPSDPTLLNYVIFKNTDSEYIVLAEEWIDTSTVVLVQTTNIAIKIFDSDISDINIAKNALSEVGFKNIEITTF